MNRGAFCPEIRGETTLLRVLEDYRWKSHRSFTCSPSAVKAARLRIVLQVVWRLGLLRTNHFLRCSSLGIDLGDSMTVRYLVR